MLCLPSLLIHDGGFQELIFFNIFTQYSVLSFDVITKVIDLINVSIKPLDINLKLKYITCTCRYISENTNALPYRQSTGKDYILIS